jgi:nucleotide-binding universal stress UspA family protein/rubrerythrin
MYRRIMVPLDNSEYSNCAAELAVALGECFGASLTGSHVYAAKMHDYRFKQMEYTLPEEYQDEHELERQRKIHDSLISMGLQLISDSYIDVMESKCRERGLAFERKMFDGRTFQPLVEDIKQSGYDLVVMGALGLGAVKDSLIGSVTERVVRRVSTDVLVTKNGAPLEEQAGGNILVGIDGSPQSFAGLQSAIAIGRAMNRQVEAVGVYDPYLHYAMFNSIVGVLSEKASKVFKFKEQEKLHEEIIDTGLAKIYQSHLEVARTVAASDGVDLKITLLDGKAFEKIIQYIRKERPWLLVLGRIGVHSDESMDIGSNAENLLRLAPCHVLLTSGKFYPPIDVKAEEAVSWTDEALARMERVPAFVKGIARTAVLRFALERGHSVVTSSVIDQVMDIFMPKRTAEAAGRAALELAVERIRAADMAAYLCEVCGHVARDVRPVQCPVCRSGSERFQTIDKTVVEALAGQEGALEEEETFDGVKLTWTEEAKKLLRTVPSGYERRRAKARIEKSARIRRLDAITKDVAAAVIDEDLEVKSMTPLVRSAATEASIVASAVLTWTEQAVARLDRVPAGFMRDITKSRIEAVAKERGAERIDLELVEAGIEVGKKIMNEVVADYSKGGTQIAAIREQYESKKE